LRPIPLIVCLIALSVPDKSYAKIFTCDVEFYQYVSPKMNGISSVIDASNFSQTLDYSNFLGGQLYEMNIAYLTQAKTMSFKGRLGDETYRDMGNFIEAVRKNDELRQSGIDTDQLARNAYASMSYKGFPSKEVAEFSDELYSRFFGYWKESAEARAMVDESGSHLKFSIARSQEQTQADDVYKDSFRRLFQTATVSDAVKQNTFPIAMVTWSEASKELSGFSAKVRKLSSSYELLSSNLSGLTIQGNLSADKNMVTIRGALGELKFYVQCPDLDQTRPSSISAPSTGNPPTKLPYADIERRLKRLKALGQKGLITADEAAQKRAELLRDM
jgi:hypothetical protein